MMDRDKDFAEANPEIYDTCLVPLIFEICAQVLPDRVRGY